VAFKWSDHLPLQGFSYFTRLLRQGIPDVSPDPPICPASEQAQFIHAVNQGFAGGRKNALFPHPKTLTYRVFVT
jgi:hypothetical protein